MQRDKVYYVHHYCSNCKDSFLMVLIDGIIKCPQCGTIVYKKEQKDDK